jgi:mannonate dehydratase
MALSSWGRTRTDIPGRGGALVTGFRAADQDAMPPLVEPGSVSAEQMWAALEYFLDAVIPEAQAAGVRMGLHPDDPPRAQGRGVPRIANSPESYRRLLARHPVRENGITFCQGNWALMGHDLPTLIREFAGQDRIAFVHFRDIRGAVDDFVETFHDEGQTDLVACMQAYRDTGFDGPMRPDHVPTMYGESNDQPAYAVLGRLFAIGYIRGLQHATYGKPKGSQ